MQVSSSLGCLVIAVEEMKFCTAARSILRSLLDGVSLDNILLPLLTAKAFRPLRTIRPGRGFFFGTFRLFSRRRDPQIIVGRNKFSSVCWH